MKKRFIVLATALSLSASQIDKFDMMSLEEPPLLHPKSKINSKQQYNTIDLAEKGCLTYMI